MVRVVVFALLALAALPCAAQYPDRNVTFLANFPPGGLVDIVTRVVADGMKPKFPHGITVVNKPGAGGAVGVSDLVQAKPDGYTILQANTNHSFSQTFYKNLGYDLEQDFSPVGRFASAFYIVVAHPKLGVTTLRELIEKARSAPGKLNYASGGVGAATFIVIEVLKAQAGIDIVHIPYNGGGPALASILSGVTEVYGSPYATAKPFVDDGKLVGLAVTSAERISYIPDTPTVAETLPGYEVTTWYGLMLPTGTPQAVRDKIQAATMQAIGMAETRKRLEELGYVTIKEKPEEFAKFLREDIEKMAALIKQYNLKPE